ncbi:adenylate/guanylate cyclase domain-containing protein [Rhodoferax sediminis]|jgi:class 3 adenylate cyclase|uniref:Adenylate/guanylate cyclase domain-containing protein n=1 Tax=Rhodoferax sediminis TaxID=2509614 RepID=A0A515DB41_9BURK|nr:adenylate/guanylate cyclase domain-containing protein [Rhodoferax sediminis]QDL37617.1 adenylate/guanylate cyclase domain-containing protein [Rhodoferax sediminis]
MDAPTTVVFADLTGSTGVFETLGNAKATQAITRLTHWIGQVCEAHSGRVVKMLGDGVLAVFPEGGRAVAAVIEMQRVHQKRIKAWPANLHMHLQVGVACGEIVEVNGDCYGDAVNVASRLSDMSGAGQIWATDTVIQQLLSKDVRFRSLGPINLKGKTEARVIYRIEWQSEVATDFLTIAGGLEQAAAPPGGTLPGQIDLSWLDVNASFNASTLPIHIGRVAEADFVINDPRVSRLHAKIEWRQGAFVLADISSYGTWVRFTSNGTDAPTELPLRRQECVLLGAGEMALGAPFSDFTVPTVAFHLSAGVVALAHRAGLT